jgi:hypothetical protein
MRLDFDWPGFEPDESMGGGARKHISKLRLENASNRHRLGRNRHER